jgi:hypothetical protein
MSVVTANPFYVGGDAAVSEAEPVRLAGGRV